MRWILSVRRFVATLAIGMIVALPPSIVVAQPIIKPKVSATITDPGPNVDATCDGGPVRQMTPLFVTFAYDEPFGQ